MNAIKKIHLWYCDIIDKTNKFSSKSKLFFSKTHEHKQKHGTVVKKMNLSNQIIMK